LAFGTRLNVPELGSHSTELLTQMGYSDEEIQALYDAGVVEG
jgi:crotonobetainyl-CoA:carnitine CoA-transferase CaiB-like acyl-CoA transferase